MMQMRTLLVAAALLGSFISCSAATEPTLNAENWATAASASSLQDFTAIVGNSHHKHHVPFTLLTKYLIRPSLAKQFTEGWLKFRKVVNNAKGSRTINLSKTLNNNLAFYSYEEWDCMKDFIEFAKESYAAKELVEYITEHDIPIELTQLVPAVPFNKPDNHSETATASQASGMPFKILEEFLSNGEEILPKKAAAVSQKYESKMESGVRNDTVIVLTKFLVKPSRIGQFVKAADLVTKAVAANEKDNLVYGLSKPLDDDVTFWSYAIWEDAAAFKRHMHSSYVKVFLKYILDQDIYVKTTPLFAIEQMDK